MLDTTSESLWQRSATNYKINFFLSKITFQNNSIYIWCKTRIISHSARHNTKGWDIFSRSKLTCRRRQIITIKKLKERRKKSHHEFLLPFSSLLSDFSAVNSMLTGASLTTTWYLFFLNVVIFYREFKIFTLYNSVHSLFCVFFSMRFLRLCLFSSVLLFYHSLMRSSNPY